MVPCRVLEFAEFQNHGIILKKFKSMYAIEKRLKHNASVITADHLLEYFPS